MNTKKINRSYYIMRNLYYVMDDNEEMFVEGDLNEHEYSYTENIDYAFRTYSKDEAIRVSNECNDIGMNTKIVRFTWKCSLTDKPDKDKTLSDLNPGDVFEDGNGIQYIVCEQLNGITIVVRKKAIENEMKFGNTNYWKDSYIREYLNEKYFKYLEDQFGEDNIIEFERDLTSLDGYDDYGKCDDKVSVMSIIEYMKYHKYIGNCESGYFLLTPDSTPSGSGSDNVRYVRSCGSVDCGWCNYVRDVHPFFCLRSSIFVF